MKDHENALVRKLEENLLQETRRLEDAVFKETSLSEKIFIYLMMVGGGAAIFSVIYVILQLIRLPREIHTFFTMSLLVAFLFLPVYVLVQLARIHK